MLQPGDVVLAAFLQDDGQSKTRPALVVEVGLNEKSGGLMVRLAYGSSKGLDTKTPWAFVIEPRDGSAFAASGLAVATRFDFHTFVWVPSGSCRPIGVISHAIGPRMMAAAKAARQQGWL